MVAEISPGVFKCGRVCCQRTVTAERPNNKRSREQAHRATAAHEARDAIHAGILDLSTLPPNPNTPHARREGYVVILATTEGWEICSKKIIRGKFNDELETSIFIQMLDWEDLQREQRARRWFAKPGSIAETQGHLDNLHLIRQLAETQVVTFKSQE